MENPFSAEAAYRIRLQRLLDKALAQILAKVFELLVKDARMTCVKVFDGFGVNLCDLNQAVLVHH